MSRNTALSQRIRRSLRRKIDLQALFTRYPELAPFLPDGPALNETVYYDAIAARLVQMALAGGASGIQASQIILNRVEGKEPERVEISGNLSSVLTVQAFRDALAQQSTVTVQDVALPEPARQDDGLEQVF